MVITKVERIKIMPTLGLNNYYYAHVHAILSDSNTLNHKGAEDLNFVTDKVWFKIIWIPNL